MAANSPKDKYFGVWLIFFMLGLGTLLPWNFFMTATKYFTSRLKDTSVVISSANQTEVSSDDRTVLEAIFNNVMTLCAMLPLLICTCLNSFLLSLISQRLRVMGSLFIIMLVFIITAVLVKVPLEPFHFFLSTMVKIVIINSFGAVLQGSLFGMAGLLPASYTTPIMSGQGLAGTFAAFAMICAIASGSELQDAAFGYFITACVVICLSILSYILLPKLEFFHFYQERNTKQISLEQNSISLMNRDAVADQTKPQDVSMLKIFKKIWILALSVCFTFTVTIGTFPAVTADTKSTLSDGGSWDQYFIPVSCFLLFNLCDWGGRSLTAILMWAKINSPQPTQVALRNGAESLFVLVLVSLGRMLLFLLASTFKQLAPSGVGVYRMRVVARKRQCDTSCIHWVSPGLHPSLHAVQRSPSCPPAGRFPSRLLLYPLHDPLCLQ
ncbi:equilibrative nucleoside transporter 1-like isoform X1 [Pelmatolapia mariae]|uniref:equilibrative nucleoside transporter 1-like isoform X1 n=1 Tax=Pelmatolapia mariae TaxID=158779 RepID=UPI002FE56A67